MSDPVVLQPGEEFTTPDGVRFLAWLGAVSGRWLLRVHPPDACAYVTNCDTLDEACTAAAAALGELRQGR